MGSIVDHPIPGGWTDREVAIGPHVFRLFTPSDPDELLQYFESPETTTQPHLADPYWAKLWPAALHLAEAIVRLRPHVGERALELGCGSGLVGIAGLASGLDVTFSDYVPFAVNLGRENAARNGFAHAMGLVLDWRTVGVENIERFPLILAADVTYDRSNIAPLLNVLDQMLAHGGEAWFGDAGRSPLEEFVNRALGRGWLVQRYDERDQPLTDFAIGRFQRLVLRKASITALLSDSA